MGARRKRNRGEPTVGNRREPPPLTEPSIVPCLFGDGISAKSTDGIVNLVAWNELPYFGGETEERRIVARLAISDRAARTLLMELQRVLFAKPHH